MYVKIFENECLPVLKLYFLHWQTNLSMNPSNLDLNICKIIWLCILARTSGRRYWSWYMAVVIGHVRSQDTLLWILVKVPGPGR